MDFESSEKVAWNAVDQFTKNSKNIDIPKIMIKSEWIGQNVDTKKESPVVDEVFRMTGATCTIFQKMNDQGDMLRTCTNVQTTDGKRAIGTYIPRTNPDGQVNPVLSDILQGKKYSGRAFVVNKWYITSYEPILNKDKKVVGMLYVGIPQDSTTTLRQAVMNVKVGKTGYVYILDSKGNYVISKSGKRDGENIWSAQDAGGNLFVQEICKKAVVLKPGEIAEQRYPWKNEGDSLAMEKIARIKYFKDWDWVIGAGSYTDEFYEAKNKVTAIGRHNNIILTTISVLSLFASIITWWLISNGLVKKIITIINDLVNGAQQVASASQQVSSASQSLAEGATEQAATLEQTSSSLEEMSSMTNQNADNANQANTLAGQTSKAANNGANAMNRMSTAINDIQKSSDATAKIIKVIDEIAFQTNLLALNAAVEAARAGEAGKGFAVVAAEVRNLAIRSAEAAKNTTNMIEESVKNAKNGVNIASEVEKVLDEIVHSIEKTSDLVGEIAAASTEQAKGIEQVNTAVAQMDKVTQQNAANAEESASASEELNAQAEQMNVIVQQLVQLVGGIDNGSQNSNKSNLTYTKSSNVKLTNFDHTIHQIAQSKDKVNTKNF
ncbi:MAG: Cache 3/Cache 2 fusion domain-containing protein [Phycisphaerales bacterium]